jgi:NADH-quinone oxidoreductase subunit L
MTVPLVLLAVLSAIGGFMGIATTFHLQFRETAHGHATVAMIASGLAVILGLALALTLYRRAARDPLPDRLGSVSRAMRNRFYFDELYEATVIRLQDALAAVMDWIDRWLIAGLAVRGLHGTTELAGRSLRMLQTGNLQTYAFVLVLGIALVLYFVIVR